ncbi:beta-ketothiolase BktB [Sphingobium fluviale]|uniref:Acetyl-CoA C-acyltransferase n=1 Tax=Sphingobium fluviale TaxID=2506423 RepID=A0A4Q1KI68_9SPHN|nr:beta-ketothiolase BktB [Sphingobium fluviale]RXR29317.1 acetyl-CoA C-acyltransferase [Sphingobium fluviale]
MTDVFLVSAARTAIGSFGGALKDQKPGELAAHVAKAAIERAEIDAAQVGNFVLGNVIHCEPRDAYAARIAAIGAGVPQESPAHTVNRLCGSGLQAILTAAQSIMLGDCDIAIGAGAEIMSRAPYFLPAVRWGQKMGDAAVVDGLTGALTDPFQAIHMGVTAENVAARYGISREEQDALAFESQKRAANAIAQGYFKEQITPVEVMVRRTPTPFDTDEFVRKDATAEDFTRLKPVFQKDGTVTAGNASGINDGAAAAVLASEAAVKAHGLKPLARLVAYGHAGVEPAYMGIGPVPATRNALQRAGLSINDLDVIESNEAFAAQACAVAKELGFDPAKVNPNGSGISLGHPVGATGAIITTKLIYELARTGGRLGLTTMCIGGGQGIAAIWERV